MSAIRLLLDTHTYLWLRLEPEKLPRELLAALVSNKNECYLSIVSLWDDDQVSAWQAALAGRWDIVCAR